MHTQLLAGRTTDLQKTLAVKVLGLADGRPSLFGGEETSQQKIVIIRDVIWGFILRKLHCHPQL